MKEGVSFRGPKNWMNLLGNWTLLSLSPSATGILRFQQPTERALIFNARCAISYSQMTTEFAILAPLPSR
jgi:hypothetical protein